VSAPRPAWDHVRADQQLAGLLQRVVEPLRLAAVVFRAALLAQRLQHRLHRRRALRRQVPGHPAGVVDRRTELQVPVLEPAVVIGVGLPGPPPLVGGPRDDREVFEISPGGGGVDQQLVDALAQLSRQLAGPLGHLGRP